MKLKELVTIRPALEKIAGMEMDAVVALGFATFLREILIIVQEFEMKRGELFQKYGEFSGEGEDKMLKILPENEEKFNGAIDEALDVDVEVPTFDIVNLVDLKITPVDLINIVSLFK